MRCLGWLLLVSLGLLAAMPAAAQTRNEKACLIDPPARTTVAACNRVIEETNAEIRTVASGKHRPVQGYTKDGLLSALYNRRGGANQTIARRHAANEESGKATEFHLRAIADFDTALRHDPTSPHAFLNRGASRAELVELDRAIKDFERALRLDPKDAQKTNAKAFNNLGGARRDKGEDAAAALADLERAIRLQPGFAHALFNRGTLHLQKEDYDRAIADYTAAMRHGSRDIDSLAARGRAWREKGNGRRAQTDFEAALALPAPDKRSKSVQDAVRELLRALREEADREEAERRKAQREDAERKEAALKEAQAAEAARKQAEAAEAARQRAKAAEIARKRVEEEAAAREKAARERAEAAKAAREQADAEKAARKEARRKAAEEAAKAEAARKEALAAAAAHKEAKRLEAEQRKQAQEDAKRAEAARKEAQRLTAEREDAERRETARRKAAAEKAAQEKTKRIALVIGNSAYQWLGPLTNPRNDAEDVAKALESLNFTVFRGIDLTYAAMTDMLTQFKDAARGAEAALFFFGGHGVGDNGINYLAPTDAPVDAGTKGRGRYVSLQKVMNDLASDVGIRILIIDACRNNPAVVEEKSGPQTAAVRSVIAVRGLVREEKIPESKGGMLVAYATLPGKVAADGVGRNSPFTRGLLKHLPTPGLELRHLFVRVRSEVFAETKGEQSPHVDDRLMGMFVFKPAQ